MCIQVIIIIVCIIFIIYFTTKYLNIRFDSFSIDKNILYQSTIDGNSYYVHKGHEDLSEAANTFYKINKDVTEFLDYLYKKYADSSNTTKSKAATLIYYRYNTNALRESSPLNAEKDTSYTINKGDIIAICIRDSISYGIQDYNTIMFVVLHELTHLSIESYDHPEEFWMVFKFILTEASLYGVYTPQDYIRYPVQYCGIVINYTPLLDLSIIDL
jgi:hypothetical protein